ncbi:hypothetical protein A0J48_024805 [Sphaerospermopsis aphanizomenoides BCCUSP55]|uniref:hypothetical protein n=1 Tax=Sphaerospermopsis aphanizomenoides TaxID=459663 RepID=UPI00190587EF|nr:hypothetical protein [Sphaerospermopsis aphanizomenoides]MBK1990696.1 hypothetical protein [Sphaerospermopsis aphanizomenoides BCCUSP55]
MDIKSRFKKYLPYLSWFFILLAIIGNIYQYRQHQAEQALEKAKQPIKERLENAFQQSKKLKQQTNQKKAEIEKMNKLAEECLKKVKPDAIECQNYIGQSVKLMAEFDVLIEENKKLLDSINKDYCLVYPDSKERDCQQVNTN